MVSTHNTKNVHIRFHVSVHSACIPLTVLGEVIPVCVLLAFSLGGGERSNSHPDYFTSEESISSVH